MRNISFFLTTEQIKNRTKTVTRRLGWWKNLKNGKPLLKYGDFLQACRKCQGLGKGGKIEKLCVIRVVSVYQHKLDELVNWNIGQEEVNKEGFPHMTPQQFVDFFCEANKCKPDIHVTRIEFEYIEHIAPIFDIEGENHTMIKINKGGYNQSGQTVFMEFQ